MKRFDKTLIFVVIMFLIGVLLFVFLTGCIQQQRTGVIIDKFITGNQYSHKYVFIVNFENRLVDCTVDIGDYYAYEIGDNYTQVYI